MVNMTKLESVLFEYWLEKQPGLLQWCTKEYQIQCFKGQHANGEDSMPCYFCSDLFCMKPSHSITMSKGI